MPIVSTPLPEVDQTITRPVVLDVIRQVQAITGISPDTPITFIGQGETRTQFGSTTASQDEVTRLASSYMVTIDVDERVDDSFFSTMAGNRPEMMPDFFDQRLGIMIKPIYTPCEYEINVTYKTPSRSEAIRWRDDARFRASQMRDVVMHELTYSYMLPEAFWKLLRHLYDLREAQAPYNQSWDDYVSANMTTRATQTSSLNGDHTRTAIRETQMRVQGFFDFQANPQQQERNNDKTAWEVKFVYRFSFSKPTSSSMRYPIVVHNQLIDQLYIPVEGLDHNRYEARLPLSTNAMHYFEADQMQKRLIGDRSITRYPTYDEWFADVQQPHTRMIASFLCAAETTAPGLLLNLQQMGTFDFDPDILDFIQKEEWRYITKPYQSLLYIGLYRNNALARPTSLAATETLDINYLEPFNLRSTYRLTISLVTDILKLDYRAFVRAQRYPAALQKLLIACGATRGQVRRLLPYADIEHLISNLPDTGFSRQQVIDAIISRKTVGTFYTQAEDLGNRLQTP